VCVVRIQGCNQKISSKKGGIFSRHFPFLSFPSPSFSRLEVAINPAKGFGGALLAPPARDNDICSHQTRSLGSKYTNKCDAFLVYV